LQNASHSSIFRLTQTFVLKEPTMSSDLPLCKTTDNTRARIMLAAETLFAEQGYAATSVRAIAAAAGVNLAAAHYHFGSKQGLLVEVIHERVTPINSCRLLALNELESQPGELDVNAIMTAFFAPFINGALKDGLPRVMARVFGEPNEIIRPILEKEFLPVTQRFISALQVALPALRSDDLAWRFHFVVGAMLHLVMFSEPLGGIPSAQSPNNANRQPVSDAFQHLHAFVVAGLLGDEQTLRRSS
jgi:AcrR family transcriptional regulator